MLGVLAAAALAAAAVPRGGPAPDEAKRAKAALEARAETCIRDNAPSVSRQSNSLSDAVDFLVADLCAREIGRFEAYRQSERTLLIQRSMLAMQNRYAQVSAADAKPVNTAKASPGGREAGTAEIVLPPRLTPNSAATALASATIDPETGELVAPADVDAEAPWVGFANLGAPSEARAQFRAAAAEAVLAAKSATKP